jgi:hypothetical protein
VAIRGVIAAPPVAAGGWGKIRARLRFSGSAGGAAVAGHAMARLRRAVEAGCDRIVGTARTRHALAA